VDARGADAVERADGAGELAFQRAELVDVLDEARGAEAVGLVEDLVADGAAARQAFPGEGEAELQHLVLRHQDLCAVAAQFVWHAHAVELLDQLGGFLGVQPAEQQRHRRLDHPRAEIDDEADGGEDRGGDHGKPAGPQRSQRS
jgi:hypothetical protein